jgi:hypothetical protein
MELKHKTAYGTFGRWHVYLVNPEEVQQLTPALQEFDNYGTAAWYRGICVDGIAIPQWSPIPRHSAKPTLACQA